MISLSRVLVDGTILSLAMGALIVGSLIYNARLWLQDYPESMRQRVPPITEDEKRTQKLLMLPFLLFMLLIPFLSTRAQIAAAGDSLPFLSAYLNTFLVLNVFNLFDAVVIDLLLLTFVKPAFAILPGTEDLVHEFRDWGVHLRNYLKGIVMCAALALPVTLAALLL